MEFDFFDELTDAIIPINSINDPAFLVKFLLLLLFPDTLLEWVDELYLYDLVFLDWAGAKSLFLLCVLLRS